MLSSSPLSSATIINMITSNSKQVNGKTEIDFNIHMLIIILLIIVINIEVVVFAAVLVGGGGKQKFKQVQ